MSEVDAIKAVADALEHLDSEERGRVLAWANSKYRSADTPPGTPVAHVPVGHHPLSTAAHNVPDVKAKPSVQSKAKSSKKAKTIISLDKSLNFTPPSKISASDFASKKAPTNVREKCVVAVYYLRDVLEINKVSAQAVYSFFKNVQWLVPADLKNTLQQAGTAGWLDTADSDDIKLTATGENRVEHQLPTKPKATS